jgi:hypothetical protein
VTVLPLDMRIVPTATDGTTLCVWCLVLPQVLTGQGLATFSLVDCCQSLLDLTLEVGILQA